MQGLQYMWVNSTKIDKPSDRARIRPQFFQNKKKNEKVEEYNNKDHVFGCKCKINKTTEKKRN